ncbi:MAG: ABC transporter ATP-binding protein [Propionibacteriales bacterium]|nr:ABC transporter ATP-binding protein [Propionibacteriales bacterium]
MSLQTTIEADPTHPPPPTRGVRSLWRLRGYLRPYWGALAIMGGTAVIGVFVSLALPLVTKAMIDGPITHHRAGPILPLGLLALVLGITEAALILVRRWVQARAILGFETAIRDDLYRHIQALPMEFHGRWQSGQLLSRVTTDLSAIRRFMGFGLLFLIINILQLTVVTLVLVRMYWPLGLVVAVSALPIIWLSKRFQSRFVLVSRRVQDEQGDVATSVEEAAVGYRVITSFGRGRYSDDNFARLTERLYASSLEKVRLSARFWTFLEIVPNLSLVVVLLLGALAVGRGELTPGTLVAFIILMLQLIWPLEALGFILAMSQEAMTAADRVLEIFDTESTVVGGDRELGDPRGALRLEHVDFHFPDSSEPVLRDVNLEVSPGETIAVVGATGSGKTALTGLIPRLYDVTGGRITIDGVDIKDLTIASLRKVVATAFEEPTLFSMSARENLTLGRPDASEDDICAAVETAQAGFVYGLPWGIDTRIGEQGFSLSGGQRQRLALARAVLAEPRILVLDDTLSALDVHTEALVETALRRVLATATGIVVAHRASTVLLADRVALLQRGTITHVGLHHELLASVPEYRDLLGGEDSGEPFRTDAEVMSS